MYGYFALLFFLKSRYLEADGSFSDLPSKVDKVWNPSDDFFEENCKDPTHFNTHLEVNDKYREHIDVKTQGMESVDSVEHIKETLMTTEIQSWPLTKNNKNNKEDLKYKAYFTRKNNENNKEDLKYKAYFTRFIKIFLRKTGLEEGKVEDSKTVTVDIILSKRDLAILKNFGSDNDITLDALENSFTSIFQPIVKYSISKMISDYMPLLNKVLLIASLIFGVLYSIHLISKLLFSKTSVIFASLVVYVSIVCLNLWQQYEDVTEKMIIKRMEFGDLSEPPKACFKSKLNIFEKIYYSLMGDDICKKFLDSRKSVWYNIDVVEAFCKPFTSTLLRLCSAIGESAERLVEPINDKCPWPLNIILNCMMSILRLPLLLFLFCIIICVLCKGRISLKMPFFSLNSGTNENINDSRKTPREELEGRQGGRTEITNHSGGIILMDSIDYGMNKDNLNFKLAKILGANTSTNLRELSLNSGDDSNKNSFPIFHSLSSTTPGNIFNKQQKLLDEKVKLKKNKWANTSTNLRELSLNSRDDSNKNSFPIFHSLSSTTPGNIFNKQQKLLDEKVKLKKNKWANTSTNLRELSLNSRDDSNKNSFPIFHSLSSTTPGNIFNKQQKLLDEKVKLKKNKWANTSTNLRELSLNSRDDSNKNSFPIFHSLSSTTPGNIFNKQQKLLDEKVKLKKNKWANTSTNLRELSLNSRDDSNKNSFPIFHSLSSTTPGNIFNKQQKLLDEKVKLKKNKFFKKRHNLKNITDESIKDIIKAMEE